MDKKLYEVDRRLALAEQLLKDAMMGGAFKTMLPRDLVDYCLDVAEAIWVAGKDRGFLTPANQDT